MPHHAIRAGGLAQLDERSERHHYARAVQHLEFGNIPEDGMMHVVKPITDSEGKPADERLVSVGIPEAVKKALVILFPDPKFPAPFKFRTQVIDLNKFRGGDAPFVNLTGYEMGVTLGEKKAF